MEESAPEPSEIPSGSLSGEPTAGEAPERDLGGAESAHSLHPLAPERIAGRVDLSDSALYLNRELSLLEFNRRVLEQARDARVPLLERLRFLTICSTNLDEFFEIRAAGLRQQIAYGVTNPGPDGLVPQEALERIHEIAHGLVEAQYELLNEELLPDLERAGVRVLSRARWDEGLCKWVAQYFRREVEPVLTPMGLDPAHPFPKVQNKSLNFLVSLRGKDAFGRESRLAVVPVPRSLPRLIPVRSGKGERRDDFVMLSSVIHAHIDEIFPSMKVTGCFQFRVTRDSDLWVDEEEVEDLMLALKGELQSRHFGEAVRLEVADNCEPEMAQFLLHHFELSEDDLYRVSGPVNLSRLVAIYQKVERPDLKYPPFIQGQPKRLATGSNLFEVLRKEDVLLHHPFQSFAPVFELVREAARDPDVLAIKQTLYRTGDESPLVEALIEASLAGKEVTVVVELRARFDEAANINLATRLAEAGAKVVYGVVGYKTHSKMVLIVRREGKKLRRYVHLGTGNYHQGTTRAYTDMSFMTSDAAITADVHGLFNQLTGLGRPAPPKRVIQSPFKLHKFLMERIRREADEARAGRPARIMARMNSLSEPKIIRSLYEASQAGVEIDLLVRGICCLRPGIPGVSESIRVRSVVGRFLEHSRIFFFHAAGKEEVYCSSADWMPRNLFSRVETCFPVEEPSLKKRVIREGLRKYFKDNVQAWLLHWDGRYYRETPRKGDPPRAAQEILLSELASEPGRPHSAVTRR